MFFMYNVCSTCTALLDLSCSATRQFGKLSCCKVDLGFAAVMQLQVKWLRVKITALAKENLATNVDDCRPHFFYIIYSSFYQMEADLGSK